MDQHSDVNWSEFIRESIKERLSEADRREIQKLVRGYEGDLVRIFALYMFAERVSERHIYETIEALFDEEHDDVVDDVAGDIQELRIDQMYKQTPDGERYSDIVIDEIENLEGDNIRTYVRDRISAASDEAKVGLSLLPHFVRDRIDDDGTSIKRRSLERTWSICAGREVDTDTLLGLGLLFGDYYSSNAYGYNKYWVPGYALDIIEEIDRHPTQFDVPVAHPDTTTANTIKETDGFGVFLDWMEGMTKYVPKHSEEDNVREFLSDVDMTYEAFADLRKRLVENNMLVIEYRPHRSSTGGRSSRPAKWKYQFTEPAQKHLAGLLAE
jgi:hypothetical protein